MHDEHDHVPHLYPAKPVFTFTRWDAGLLVLIMLLSVIFYALR